MSPATFQSCVVITISVTFYDTETSEVLPVLILNFNHLVLLPKSSWVVVVIKRHVNELKLMVC